MIHVKEISVNELPAFWESHISYLIQDGVLSDADDIAYFQSDEYRLVIRAHMLRHTDRHHIAYFVEDARRIGAVSYCTYQSEDGKCLICDYWIFAEHRRKGNGHRCFNALEQYTRNDGALYYEINCDGREDRMRFWRSLGFEVSGRDEYDVLLLTRR